MYKRSVCIILLICLLQLCNARSRKRENGKYNRTALNSRNYSSNCPSIPIDIRLHDLSAYTADFRNESFITLNSKPTGLLEILHPHTPSPLFLCYPSEEDDFRQIYVLSHIACRQLSLMTFTDVNRKELPTFNDKHYYGLKPNSYSCTGQEQTISHCNWHNLSIGICSMITEVSCGACHKIIKGACGTIKSPGYPLIYFYNTICQWDIIVPDRHTILLTFNRFDAIDSGVSSRRCELHKPYIEIIYGNQNHFSVHRYCSLQDVKNLSIPFREAKIRIFSGFHKTEKFLIQEKEQGLIFSFEAIPIEERHSSLWKIIFLTLFFCIAIMTIVLCHYCQKQGICDYKQRETSDLPEINLSGIEELNSVRSKAFQSGIQRTDKTNQSLRMRSVGSESKLTNQFFPNSAGTNYEIAIDFRKQQTKIETPRTGIPAINLNAEGGDEEKENTFHRAKVNLLDRYSDRDIDGSTNKQSVDSSIFCPAGPRFQIYRNISSEKSKEEKETIQTPRETRL